MRPDRALIVAAHPQRRSIAARLALAAVTLLGWVALVGLAELAARVWFPEWGPIRAERARLWGYDEQLGWAHAPSSQGRFTHPDFSVEVTINARGLRDDEYPTERTNKRRMLVLGDSYAWGFGVELRERFSEQLERRHSEWEIINAAVSGYGTGQEYLYLDERGIIFRPDVVLLLVCENDFTDNVRQEDYWHFRPYFELEGGKLALRGVPVPGATFGQLRDRFLLGRTHLGSRIYLATDAIKHRLWPEAEHTRSLPAPPPPDDPSTVAVMEALLRALAGRVHGAGATLVVVSIPMVPELRAALERSARELQAHYLALDEFVPADDARLRFEHDIHWNAAGHLRAADAIDRFLADAGVWTTPH
jgi:lysophospholipase L1-like esterase